MLSARDKMLGNAAAELMRVMFGNLMEGMITALDSPYLVHCKGELRLMHSFWCGGDRYEIGMLLEQQEGFDQNHCRKYLESIKDKWHWRHIYFDGRFPRTSYCGGQGPAAGGYRLSTFAECVEAEEAAEARETAPSGG